METLETLSAKLAATQDIRTIVRTMKALSSASIHQYERAITAMADYERAVTLGLQIVLRDQAGAGARSPRIGPVSAPGQRRALIVIGSDRGLCGLFNDRIAAFAAEQLEDDMLLCVLGVRTAARLEALGHRGDSLFALPSSVGGLSATVQAVAVEMDRWIRTERVASVSVAFNRRRGGISAEPVQRLLFPLPRHELDALARAPWPSPRLPVYRMDRDRLFSWLARQHLFVVLYRALAESLAAEHAARLAAMQGAERNIGERGEAILAAYRKTRQETITRELLDVVAGFEAGRSHRDAETED